MAELDPVGPIVGVLFEDQSSDYVLKVLSLAGIPAHFELSTQELYSNNTRKRAYRERLVPVLARFSEAQRIQAAENIAREIAGNEATRSRLEEVLRNVGWTVAKGRLIPLGQTRTTDRASDLQELRIHLLDALKAARTTLQFRDLREAMPQYRDLPDETFCDALQDLESDGMIEARFIRTGISEKVRAAYNIEITPRGRALTPDTSHSTEVTQQATPITKPTQFAAEPIAPTEASRMTVDRTAEQPTATVPSVRDEPRVFISYSWDSEGHKEWVRALAIRLRKDGIDAIVDQTHLLLGERSPEFMERSVRESGCVLVICTERYKRRFDDRQGGAGYEGHIITGEIIEEVGKNKFIPVLRAGDWKNALPTALSGTLGADLSNDSGDEYTRLLKRLHGVSEILPIGPRPEWLDDPSGAPDGIASPKEAATPDPAEYSEQRKSLGVTEILRKVRSKPHWRIWIRPTTFRRARFRDVEQCRAFMMSSYVLVEGWFPYPWFSADALDTGDEWISGKIEWRQNGVSRLECWALFRSGQFVHERAFDEIPQLGERVHPLEILDTVTGALELAERMALEGVLSLKTAVTFELHGVAGRSLTWREDRFGPDDAVGPNCWCQDENVTVLRTLATDQLKTRRRELALEVALEIYSRFAWSNAPKDRLRDEQTRRFGGI